MLPDHLVSSPRASLLSLLFLRDLFIFLLPFFVSALETRPIPLLENVVQDIGELIGVHRRGAALMIGRLERRTDSGFPKVFGQ
jgi:hypothetical protein